MIRLIALLVFYNVEGTIPFSRSDMRVMRAEGVDFVKEHVDRKEPCLHDKDPETVTNDPETVKRPIQDPETVKKDPETVKRPIPCHKEGEVYKAKATIDGSGESKVGIERQLKPAVNQATTTSATAPCASADGGSEAEGHVCETSDWEAWSPCSATCGQHGNSTRSRTVLKQSLRDGPPCAELNQVRECQLPECPLDCVWLEWSEWGSCSVSCGTGTKFSTRDRFFERFGGSACVGSDARSEGCLVKQCSTNCTMSPWSDWFACSTSCGNGTATRYRNVETVADNTNCSNPTSESAACCNQECPIDCVLGSWTDWTSCGNGCNVDHSTRTRNVVVEPKAGGLTCDVTSEAKNCSSLCHVDCRYGPWSDWNYCSITCGAGTRSRLRAEVVTQQGTGEDCTGARQNIQSCTSTDCPVDCQASEWTEWSACSSSCGSDSFADRTRDVTSLADKNGLPCPGGNETHQQKRCSQQACPVACEWTDWQEWRSCTRTCGHGGTQLRMRLVATPSQHGGIECQGNSTDTQECTDVPSCPEPCSWNDWSDWIQCSASCGSNSTTRRNRTYMPAVHGGQACFGDSEQEKSCYEPPCPVNGVWSDWSEWNCQASCSPATQKRYREKTEPEHGGKECQGSAVETSACENIPLCPVDCTWSHWSTWSFCSATCGVGTRTRLRNRTQYEEHGGGSCYGTQDDEAVCTAGECPQDCVVGDWSHWTACPASCGTGNRTRHRKVQREAKNGGADCPSDLLQTDCCATKDCPVDCEWSDWRDWSECPNSCGGGIQTRVRHEAQFPWHGGLPCDGGIKQDSVCNEQSCPMDCKFAEWSDWGQCSATCGSGKKEMMRHKINIAMFGGKDCTGPEKLVEDCNNGECSIDCAWAEWTNWTECSKSCETGLTQRTRAHSINVSQGGAECVGVAQEETACNTHGCAQDCQWGPWSKWTPCSKQCGGGSTKRFRDVVSVRKNYGLACEGEDQQEELCNVAECAINCEWDEWTSWSTCSSSCNGGFRARTRGEKVPGKYGGAECQGDSREKLPCDLPPCPIDCTFTAWSSWGNCSTFCGIGRRFKTRSRLEGRYGGVDCVGGLISSEDCTNFSGCVTTTEPATTTTETPCTTLNVTKVLEEYLANQSKIKPCDTAEVAVFDTEADTGSESLSESIEKKKYLRQGKEVSSVISGSLVLSAKDPQAMAGSGSVKVGLERMFAKFANVDSGAVDVAVKVPTEEELAAAKAKDETKTGNVLAEYTVYLYKADKRTPEAVSKEIAKHGAGNVNSEMEILGPDFASVAVSMSLRMTKPEDH